MFSLKCKCLMIMLLYVCYNSEEVWWSSQCFYVLWFETIQPPMHFCAHVMTETSVSVQATHICVMLKACLTPHQVLDLSHPHLFLKHISTLTRMRNGLPCVVLWEWEEGTSITGVHYPPSINYLRSCWHCEPVEVSKPTYTCVSNDWHQKWSSSGYGLYFKTHAPVDVRSRNNLPQCTHTLYQISIWTLKAKSNHWCSCKTDIHMEMEEMLCD